MKAKKQHKPSDVLECEICCAACKHQMMTGTVQVLYLQAPDDDRPGVRPPVLHRLLDRVPHHQDHGRGQIIHRHPHPYNIVSAITIPHLQLSSQGASQMIECPGSCNIVVNDQTVRRRLGWRLAE